VTSSRGAGFGHPCPRGRVLVVATRVLSVGVGLVAAACTAATQPAPLAPDNARRVERSPLWPSPAVETEASAGLFVLRPPPARQLARRTVQAFFDAVRRESVGELSAWLAEDATISSGPGTTPESIAKVWAARFKQLDYGFSGAKEPYRADDVGLFTADELVGLVPARRFELVPDADEVLAVVTTRDRRRAAGPRHFGKRLEFVLGPSAGGYRIRRMFEDFRLP
jgi:hypothetical protein